MGMEYGDFADILELAADTGDSLCILCVDAPQLLSESNGESTKPSISPLRRAILDRRVSSATIILNDPQSLKFLRNLDLDHTSTADRYFSWNAHITLIRDLTRLSHSVGSDKLKVGIRDLESAWNVVIVADQTVFIRPVENFHSCLNHHAPPFLRLDNIDRLADSFIKHWQIVSSSRVEWLDSLASDYFTDSPRWPGLYKGNVVIPLRAKSGIRRSPSNEPPDVLKLCMVQHNRQGEMAWTAFAAHFDNRVGSFHPIRMTVDQSPPCNFRGTPAVSMQRVDGISVFELTAALVRISHDEWSSQAASRVLGILIYESLRALAGFRLAACQIVPAIEREAYPYGKQLRTALEELNGLGSNRMNSLIADAIEDAVVIGAVLEQHSHYPFRDAHLKNRIWTTRLSSLDLALHLAALDENSISEELKESVWDIDFETSLMNVTEWDDVIHVLFFERGAADPARGRTNCVSIYEQWWGSIRDKNGFYTTVLARAGRELCRRLWYARNMPNAYQERYSLETRDYFLRLALWSAAKLPQYRGLQALLREIHAQPNSWGDAPATTPQGALLIPVLPKASPAGH